MYLFNFSGLAFQPVLYSYSSQGNVAVVVASGAFLSFFTFATPLLIHSISKKYVTKLYYNQVCKRLRSRPSVKRASQAFLKYFISMS